MRKCGTPRSMSFDTITLWSTLSNALLKSANKERTEPPLSRVWHQKCSRDIKAWAVERPFKQPNWYWSTAESRRLWSQLDTKDSKTFAKTGNKSKVRGNAPWRVYRWNNHGKLPNIRDFPLSDRTIEHSCKRLGNQRRKVSQYPTGKVLWAWSLISMFDSLVSTSVTSITNWLE